MFNRKQPGLHALAGGEFSAQVASLRLEAVPVLMTHSLLQQAWVSQMLAQDIRGQTGIDIQALSMHPFFLFFTSILEACIQDFV